MLTRKDIQRLNPLRLSICFSILLFCFSINAEPVDSTSTTYITPTKRVDIANYPTFSDDLEFSDLDTALERQIYRFRSRSMAGNIRLGSDTYPLTQIRTTLMRFRTLILEYKKCIDSKNRPETCRGIFNEKIKSNFLVYEPELKEGDPRYGETEPVLFTAYYTPTIYGSRGLTNEFPYAIYKSPTDKTSLGYTRTEIDFDKKLSGKKLEIFHTDDLFNLYLMHVQGGGKIRYVEKGKTLGQYLTYDGTNGKQWKFISKYMLDKKYISDPSIAAQREYLQKHPEKQEEIYSSCPSYVYFKPTTLPPLGNDKVPLTDNRSIATDSSLYAFKGMLAFVDAKRPDEQTLTDFKETKKEVPYKPYQRFYLDQDTGGAIKGKGRVDLYFGEGEYAELAAYNTKHTGKLFFLMARK